MRESEKRESREDFPKEERLQRLYFRGYDLTPPWKFPLTLYKWKRLLGHEA